jgi:hypothetical protein
MKENLSVKTKEPHRPADWVNSDTDQVQGHIGRMTENPKQ